MKRLLATAAFLLASALCLAACAPTDGATRASVADATGTPYREEKIRLPEDAAGVVDVREDDRGELLAAGSSGPFGGERVAVYAQDADGSWTERFSTDELAASLGGDVRFAACLTPEGRLLCTATLAEGAGAGVYLVGEEGFSAPPLSLGADVFRLRVADDGSVFAVGGFSDGFARYDLTTGEKLCEVKLDSGEFFSDFAVHDGLVYVVASRSSGAGPSYAAKAFDPLSGEEAKIDPGMQAALNATLPTTDGRFDEAPPMLSSGAHGLYVCAQGSVFRCTPEGAERVLAGSGTHLENANQHPDALLALSGGGFVIRYSDRGLGSAGSSAYRYVEGEAAAPTTSLTVYALEASAGIQQAVATFRDERPDVAVELRVGIPDGSGLSVDDAVRALNADLLAGTGPDVLVLDGLPLRSLTDQGMLLDVSGVLDEASVRDEMFENALAAFAGEDGCFALPTRFTVPVMLGGVDVLSRAGSLDELADFLEADGQARSALAPSFSLAALYASSYPGLEGEDALTSFFENAKRLLEAGEASVPEPPADLPEGIPAYDYLGSHIGAIADSASEAGALSGGSGLLASDARFTVGSVFDPLDFGGMSIAQKYAEYPCDLEPVAFDGVRTFEPRAILGVSAASGQEAAAKDFLLYALAKPQQSQRTGAGLPVSKAAFEEALAAAGGYSIGFMGGPGEQMFERGPFTESEIASYASLLEGATVPVVHDKAIDDAVSEALLAYCRDESTLEEAVSAALQKITLYQAQ